MVFSPTYRNQIRLKKVHIKVSQKSSEKFGSERKKQQQRVLCNENRRLPNELIKQLIVRIETIVRKAYSLKIDDYKNTKMTEVLMMTQHHNYA